MNKGYLITAIALVVAAVVAVAALSLTPLSAAQGDRELFIDGDDTADSVFAKIDTMAHAPQMIALKTLARHAKYDEHLHTGRYILHEGDNAITTIRRLVSGAQTPLNITIPEARTMERLAAMLSRHLMADSTALITTLKDSATIAPLGYDTATIAALFIPNTYSVYWDVSPEAFLHRMAAENARFWTIARTAKAEALHLSRNDVATLASIVDEETAVNAEKPTIAGLYLNRLQKGMLLQADPTVKYANGDFTIRRVLHKHLTIDSPYNTYMYEGLPPGPIKIPSVAGIDAVLNAEKHAYLYMCAKEDFSGTHNFATTYGEHLRNAARYTRALNERGIK